MASWPHLAPSSCCSNSSFCWAAADAAAAAALPRSASRFELFCDCCNCSCSAFMAAACSAATCRYVPYSSTRGRFQSTQPLCHLTLATRSETSAVRSQASRFCSELSPKLRPTLAVHNVSRVTNERTLSAAAARAAAPSASRRLMTTWHQQAPGRTRQRRQLKGSTMCHLHDAVTVVPWCTGLPVLRQEQRAPGDAQQHQCISE